MAARRLIVVMLVLLGISTAIAMIVPEPENRNSDSPSTAATGETGATGDTGATGSTGDTGSQDQDGSERSRPGVIEVEVGKPEDPDTVKAKPGERVILTVAPGRPADVEVDGLGLFGTTTTQAPVVFDILLPDDPTDYRVMELGKEDPLAVIQVGDRDEEPDAAPETKPAAKNSQLS